MLGPQGEALLILALALEPERIPLGEVRKTERLEEHLHVLDDGRIDAVQTRNHEKLVKVPVPDFVSEGRKVGVRRKIDRALRRHVSPTCRRIGPALSDGRCRTLRGHI